MDAMCVGLEEVLLEAMNKGKMHGFMEPWRVNEKTFFIVRGVILALALVAVIMVYLDWL